MPSVVLCRWEENWKVSWYPATILKHLIPVKEYIFKVGTYIYEGEISLNGDLANACLFLSYNN